MEEELDAWRRGKQGPLLPLRPTEGMGPDARRMGPDVPRLQRVHRQRPETSKTFTDLSAVRLQATREMQVHVQKQLSAIKQAKQSPRLCANYMSFPDVQPMEPKTVDKEDSDAPDVVRQVEDATEDVAHYDVPDHHRADDLEDRAEEDCAGAVAEAQDDSEPTELDDCVDMAQDWRPDDDPDGESFDDHGASDGDDLGRCEVVGRCQEDEFDAGVTSDERREDAPTTRPSETFPSAAYAQQLHDRFWADDETIAIFQLDQESFGGGALNESCDQDVHELSHDDLDEEAWEVPATLVPHAYPVAWTPSFDNLSPASPQSIVHSSPSLSSEDADTSSDELAHTAKYHLELDEWPAPAINAVIGDGLGTDDPSQLTERGDEVSDSTTHALGTEGSAFAAEAMADESMDDATDETQNAPAATSMSLDVSSSEYDHVFSGSDVDDATSPGYYGDISVLSGTTPASIVELHLDSGADEASASSALEEVVSVGSGDDPAGTIPRTHAALHAPHDDDAEDLTLDGSDNLLLHDSVDLLLDATFTGGLHGLSSPLSVEIPSVSATCAAAVSPTTALPTVLPRPLDAYLWLDVLRRFVPCMVFVALGFAGLRCRDHITAMQLAAVAPRLQRLTEGLASRQTYLEATAHAAKTLRTSVALHLRGDAQLDAYRRQSDAIAAARWHLVDDYTAAINDARAQADASFHVVQDFSEATIEQLAKHFNLPWTSMASNLEAWTRLWQRDVATLHRRRADVAAWQQRLATTPTFEFEFRDMLQLARQCRKDQAPTSLPPLPSHTAEFDTDWHVWMGLIVVFSVVPVIACTGHLLRPRPAICLKNENPMRHAPLQRADATSPHFSTSTA
ncbi:hypothetical protein SDRG_14468 [Saprolegnia diclina VS20]|uniref:Uncharacterized protein n=1 Tax=Saprolegnia diclina (strain VS20) TaxID=1156394 RepID=T0Q2T3_SAPDV|nr:hypothetical protein SDRG_14468 [Saprolegnia diclina VS20]EQC27715.1 hypothetical protein SDRG_14468 [Saprolegnia diclina VS20]|eukprot:XP_008618820.1 hypothetical protein SDRG_14468 [Saprolegnia diclina VS20]